MLETPRLLLRKFQKEDAEAFFKVIGNDNVCRYMSNNTFPNVERVNKLLDYWIPLYIEPDTIRYAIILKANNELIGYIDVVDYHEDIPEIGYALNEDYWSKGYMKEALDIMSEYLFTLGFQEIILGVVKENIGSSKVAMKCGYGLYLEERKILSENKNYLVDICWYKKKNPNYKEFIKMVPITQDNIEIAHEMENVIFPHYDAYNNYLDSFKEENKNVYWILEVNGQNVGISGIYSYKIYPDDAWLAWFGILEEYRNHKLGAQALALFEIYARRHGFRYARLFTNRYDNDDAKRFYEAHGYTEEYYELASDPASLLYPLSIYSKPLVESERVPKWNNHDIHFTKQVKKQQ